jgi:hypothetical protein
MMLPFETQLGIRPLCVHSYPFEYKLVYKRLCPDQASPFIMRWNFIQELINSIEAWQRYPNLIITAPVSYLTLMPLILGFSVTEVNWITIWPLELAVAVNDRAMALFWPPADA